MDKKECYCRDWCKTSMDVDYDNGNYACIESNECNDFIDINIDTNKEILKIAKKYKKQKLMWLRAKIILGISYGIIILAYIEYFFGLIYTFIVIVITYIIIVIIFIIQMIILAVYNIIEYYKFKRDN